MIRILVADDEVLIAQGIRQYLEHAGLQVIAVASDGEEAVAKTLELKPDVVLLDITMPGKEGLEALAEIKAARPETTVIMLTGHRKPALLVQALIGGAAGYLTKTESGMQNLPNLIRSSVEGSETIVDRDLLQRTIEQLTRDPSPEAAQKRARVRRLTDQETRVLRLIALGYNNLEIAGELVISRNTVKSHVHNILGKLRVSDRTQAAILAHESGIMDLGPPGQESG